MPRTSTRRPTSTVNREAPRRPPRGAGRMKLDHREPLPEDWLAARAAATPDQLADQMAEVLAAAFEARGTGGRADLIAAGFTPAQIALHGDAASARVPARLSPAARAREHAA